MSREEFIRLVKLNWYCPKERVAERTTLRLKVGKIALHWSFLLLGWLTVIALLPGTLKPPFTAAAIPAIAFTFTLILVMLPITGKFLSIWKDGWLLIALRFILAMIGIGYLLPIQIPLIEQARLDSLTPEQRDALELRERSQAVYDQVAVDRERQAEEATKSARRQAEAAIAELNSRAQAANNAEREQHDFYNTLGAPKLLYRCGKSGALQAVGATRGSINVILQSAYAECSSSSLEIVKRKD